MESELRREAEKYLGFAICPQEWDEAKRYAEHKLARIIQREGDAGGERRKPYYLAQLIAETVRANIFSGILFELAELQWEQKKTARA